MESGGGPAAGQPRRSPTVTELLQPAKDALREKLKDMEASLAMDVKVAEAALKV